MKSTWSVFWSAFWDAVFPPKPMGIAWPFRDDYQLRATSQDRVVVLPRHGAAHVLVKSIKGDAANGVACWFWETTGQQLVLAPAHVWRAIIHAAETWLPRCACGVGTCSDCTDCPVHGTP